MLNSRSARFEEYLRNQPAARRAEISAAEKRYAAAHAASLASYEEIFMETMHGYEETPAGPGSRKSLALFGDDGDWSWQPQRYSDDPADTPTYRPRRHPRACTRCGLASCLSLICSEVMACA